MQIHEITEGFLGDLKQVGSSLFSKNALSGIGQGFAQGVTGTDIPRAQPAVDTTALRTAASALSPATERIVVTLSQPGQTVPAKYYKTKDSWTNELGEPITNSKQTAYLEKLIPTHGEKEIIAPQSAPRKISRRRAAR